MDPQHPQVCLQDSLPTATMDRIRFSTRSIGTDIGLSQFWGLRTPWQHPRDRL